MYTWSFVGQKYTDELTLHIVNGKKTVNAHCALPKQAESVLHLCTRFEGDSCCLTAVVVQKLFGVKHAEI